MRNIVYQIDMFTTLPFNYLQANGIELDFLHLLKLNQEIKYPKFQKYKI